ncbi:redoxin domain-containing protein, partial [Chloroflexota bacterium]
MPERKSPIQKGEKAPDLTLKDQNSDEFKLSAEKGKRVLLSFHPLAWTNICAKQMQSLEANTDIFASLNVIPIGISIDSVPTKKAWADSLRI